MAKSKFFRAFVEGQTISDGRKIDKDWIDQIVETFNVETYTPRINVEHIAGFSPEPPFNGYGDVVAVKAQDDVFSIANKDVKLRALYCQVDGNDQLTALVDKGQKPFPSVELTESYAGTGKVGLVALAFTDSPASIGTQKLQFSRSAPGTLFATLDESVDFGFEAKPADPTGIADAIKAGFAALGAKFAAKAEEPPKEDPQKPANDNFDAKAFAVAMGDTVAKAVADAVKPTADGLAALSGEFNTLKSKLETEDPDPKKRSFSAGNSDRQLADF